MSISRGPVDILYGCFWSDGSACLDPVRPVADYRFTFLTAMVHTQGPTVDTSLRSLHALHFLCAMANYGRDGSVSAPLPPCDNYQYSHRDRIGFLQCFELSGNLNTGRDNTSVFSDALSMLRY